MCYVYRYTFLIQVVVSIASHAGPEQSLDLVTVVLATSWVSKVRLLRVLSLKPLEHLCV